MFREVSGASEPEMIKALVLSYRAHYREIGIHKSSLFPGTIETLQALRKGEKMLAVASNKPDDFGMTVMRDAGLLPYFASLQFNRLDGFSLAYTKTELIRRAMEEMGGHSFIMVGDSVVDIRSAKEAGIPVIACAFKTSPEEDLRKEVPDALVREFRDIARILL